jgi:hypothetical protein
VGLSSLLGAGDEPLCGRFASLETRPGLKGHGRGKDPARDLSGLAAADPIFGPGFNGWAVASWIWQAWTLGWPGGWRGHPRAGGFIWARRR